MEKFTLVLHSHWGTRNFPKNGINTFFVTEDFDLDELLKSHPSHEKIGDEFMNCVYRLREK